MSDVIEVMARQIAAHVLGDPEEEARSWIKDALRDAEKAGWRLVPVEPTKEMLHVARHIDFDGPEFTLPDVIEAAPRPWADA